MQPRTGNTEILTYGIDPQATETEGKFLQLRMGGREYLIFSRRELHRFHNQIFAHFLEEHGISHHWVDDTTLQAEAPDLTIIGGGRFRVKTGSRTLELWDNSQAYGRFDERGLKDKIAASTSPWKNFSITITA